MIAIHATSEHHAADVDYRPWKLKVNGENGVKVDPTDEMDFFEDCLENKTWDPDYHFPYNWDDIEPLLNKLSELDKMIVWYSYHEYYYQTEIAKMLHWSQTSVSYRLKKIIKTLRLLMRPPLTYEELNDTTLKERDKMYLLTYDKCLGNLAETARMLRKNTTSVRYIVLNAKRKLNGSHHKIMDKLSYPKDPVFVRSHVGQLFDRLVTR